MLGCCSAIQLVEEGGGDVRGEAALVELITQLLEEGGGDFRGGAVGRELVTQIVEE